MDLEENTQVLPAVALRGIVVFPYMQINFDAARGASVAAIDESVRSYNSRILLVSQRQIDKQENITSADVCEIGTIAVIRQVMHLPGNVTRLIVNGLSRGVIRSYISESPSFLCEVEPIDETYCGITDRGEAYRRAIKQRVKDYFAMSANVETNAYLNVMEIKHLGQLCDTTSAMINFDTEVKQELLEEQDFERRAERLIEALDHIISVTKLEQQINRKTHERVNEHQREYYLREQMEVIRGELGDDTDIKGEADEFEEKLNELELSEDTAEKLRKDIRRFSRLPSQSPDSGLLRMYLETVFDLPWNERTEEVFDIKKAGAVLDEDHYGLEKVKERILEFLAVRQMTGGRNSTILCLEGPPGVGKTSVARSVARALGRKFVRVSLGGIHDESDIRGHRKTYIGAMEGRIMAAMREAKVKNPVMLLDEIDKMGADYKGDPSAALLEVLDNEQNAEFRDHYIEVPFDLSEVLFITTANTLDSISSPLLDRMEVIRLSGYTESEKFKIAKGYLIKKALDKTGMDSERFSITAGAVKRIISNYTREAGVRKLEQTLETLCRKAAKRILETGAKNVRIDVRNLGDFLGRERYRFDLMNEKDQIGVARGLAWTAVGGETLSVEANVMKGSGKVELTGKLGDVMKESAKAAISYIRSASDKLGIDGDFHKEKDIHIHVPEGAVPKDGPSAGITMAVAVISSLIGRPVRRDVAMTGEITLRGRVLPIGGLKEKSMAAYRAGIRTVVIPEENKKDIDEIPKEIRDEITFVPVSDMDAVIKTVLA